MASWPLAPSESGSPFAATWTKLPAARGRRLAGRLPGHQELADLGTQPRVDLDLAGTALGDHLLLDGVRRGRDRPAATSTTGTGPVDQNARFMRMALSQSLSDSIPHVKQG
jgi:hypothetical protein